jgi:hypothetical protein
VYKEALSLIEEQMPGTRTIFYRGFLDPGNPLRKGAEAHRTGVAEEGPDSAEGGTGGIPRACASCAAPTFAEVCSFCRLKERVRKRREERAGRAAG